MKGIADNTVRIARFKLLFIAAKVVKDGNRDKVKYSIHDARTPAMLYFLEFFRQTRARSQDHGMNPVVGRNVLPCQYEQEISCTDQM